MSGFFLIPSLNRTSVGLKLRKRHVGLQVDGPPQSNQRGIETGPAAFGGGGGGPASIEPAWD